MAKIATRSKSLGEYEVTITKTTTVVVSIYAKDEDHARQKIADGEWNGSDEIEIDCNGMEIVSVRRMR